MKSFAIFTFAFTKYLSGAPGRNYVKVRFMMCTTSLLTKACNLELLKITRKNTMMKTSKDYRQ